MQRCLPGRVATERGAGATWCRWRNGASPWANNRRIHRRTMSLDRRGTVGRNWRGGTSGRRSEALPTRLRRRIGTVSHLLASQKLPFFKFLIWFLMGWVSKRVKRGSSEAPRLGLLYSWECRFETTRRLKWHRFIYFEWWYFRS